MIGNTPGGDPAVAAAWTQVLAGNPCITAPDAIEPGSVVYETEPAGGSAGPGRLHGARLGHGDRQDLRCQWAGVADHGPPLVDLDNAGNKTLVARGGWRPKASGLQVFQLHPGAWKVEEGHSLRLELLPRDAKQNPPGILNNFARPVQ